MAQGNLRSLTRHALTGLAVMALLVFGLGGWAATTEIAGAVVAPGLIAVEGGSRRVQHAQGGVVREILVQNNQSVAAGEPLLRLDDTALRAALKLVLWQLRDAISEQARLSAESTGNPILIVPAIVSDWPLDPELAAALGDQERLRHTRQTSLTSREAQFGQQIAEKQSSIASLKAQQQANASKLDLMKDELSKQESLFAKGLVAAQRLNDLKRGLADLEATTAALQSSIAANEANITELQMQSSQLTTDFRSQVMLDLQSSSQKVAELLEKKLTLEDQLTHMEIVAPIAGTVHESIVHTVGGVVGAGETLMLIVPAEDRLLVEARVSPLDIDKLHPGQEAEVRLSGFDARTTPELPATIRTISPDLIRDPRTGSEYYSIDVDVASEGGLPASVKLVAGMPVEVFFGTDTRTVLSYLLNPVTEQLQHTFRE